MACENASARAFSMILYKYVNIVSSRLPSPARFGAGGAALTKGTVDQSFGVVAPKKSGESLLLPAGRLGLAWLD